MVTTAATLMTNAGIRLQDERHVRWTLLELGRWIDEAVKAICLANPAAATRSIILPLAKGTRQKLPLETLDNGDQPLALKKITRNISDLSTPGDGGRIVTVVSGRTLDAQEPNWTNAKVVRFNKTVRHYVYDEKNPLEFLVYPGNDGHGAVEAVISYCPASIVAKVQKTANDTENLQNWELPIDLPDPWSTCIAEYLMYQALLKNDTTGSSGRAAFHFSQFQTMLAAKADADNATSPNVERQQQ